jgi:hypothetical protein
MKLILDAHLPASLAQYFPGYDVLHTSFLPDGNLTADRTINEISMARSRKRVPITGITNAKTEKNNKRKANRKFRRLTKVQIKKGGVQITSIKEVSNVWSFDKDGKQFLHNPTKKDFRK